MKRLNNIDPHVELRAGDKPGKRRDRIVLEIGTDFFTCSEIVKLMELPMSCSATILSKALKRFHPKNVKEVAKRIKAMDLRRLGVGYWSMLLWLHILEISGVAAIEWLESDKQLSTICAGKKWRRKKRR